MSCGPSQQGDHLVFPLNREGEARGAKFFSVRLTLIRPWLLNLPIGTAGWDTHSEQILSKPPQLLLSDSLAEDGVPLMMPAQISWGWNIIVPAEVSRSLVKYLFSVTVSHYPLLGIIAVMRDPTRIQRVLQLIPVYYRNYTWHRCSLILLLTFLPWAVGRISH